MAGSKAAAAAAFALATSVVGGAAAQDLPTETVLPLELAAQATRYRRAVEVGSQERISKALLDDAQGLLCVGRSRHRFASHGPSPH